ncbi:hypothetical protein C8F01DRAFT_977295, partial [Mycena amicta]
SGANVYAVCAVCLRPHENLTACRSSKLWNDMDAHCSRNGGKLTNPAGISLCLNFQRAGGCQGAQGNGPKHIHECSGCGQTDHGASNCHLRAPLETPHTA